MLVERGARLMGCRNLRFILYLVCLEACFSEGKNWFYDCKLATMGSLGWLGFLAL
jgi:hypothetical protein